MPSSLDCDVRRFCESWWAADTLFLLFGIDMDELAMVARAGRDEESFSLDPGANLKVLDASGEFVGMGICSALSLLFFGEETWMGGGLRFCFMGPSEESDESMDELFLLSCRSLLRVMATFGLEIGSESDKESGVSPFFSLASRSLELICRPRFVSSTPLRLLAPLSLRLLFARSFPSMILADGGGCSIHFVAPLWVGCELTMGGCKSFNGGFLAI